MEKWAVFHSKIGQGGFSFSVRIAQDIKMIETIVKAMLKISTFCANRAA
jgi:hypothetical protein